MNWRMVAVAAVLPVLTACVPWTIRPIESKESAETKSISDPAAFAQSVWASKLVPAVLQSAVPARVLLDALAASPTAASEKYGRRESGGAYQFMVKGEGRVTAVDTRSRNGLLLVDIAPYDGRPDVSIQIGPVLRGTSLRDATGLIRFTDFENQIQFADVSNEINKRVSQEVLAAFDPASIKGKTVSFAGTFSLEGTGEPPIRGVIPVKLTAESGK